MESKVYDQTLILPLSATMARSNGILNVDCIQAELRFVVEEFRSSTLNDELPQSVRRALIFIHDHLFEDTLDASYVRRQCNLHNNNVSSRFKRLVGMGMRQYIEYGRMEAAGRLLQYEHLSIVQIAWAIGYAYPESFARAFKRYYGCTASAYRKKETRRNVKTRGEGSVNNFS